MWCTAVCGAQEPKPQQVRRRYAVSPTESLLWWLRASLQMERKGPSEATSLGFGPATVTAESGATP